MATGQSWWCSLPTVAKDAFAVALANFARDEGIDADQHGAVVLDHAGWNLTHAMSVPAGIDLLGLPPVEPSPTLQQ